MARNIYTKKLNLHRLTGLNILHDGGVASSFALHVPMHFGKVEGRAHVKLESCELDLASCELGAGHTGIGQTPDRSCWRCHNTADYFVDFCFGFVQGALGVG